MKQKRNVSIRTALSLGLVLFILITGFVLMRQFTSMPTTEQVRAACEQKRTDMRQCWEDFIIQTVHRHGMDKAFTTMDTLYRKDQLFAANCHEYAHTLGKEGYRLFAGKKAFAISPQTAMCGYGFYHGFMETLLGMSGDVTKAKDFCETVKDQLSGSAPAAYGACYHGFGHGNVNVHDQKLWGKRQELIDEGLRVCEKVADTKLNLYLCATGVFNAISIDSLGRQYGLSINESDPLEVCRVQKKEYQKPCFADAMVVVSQVTDHDFLQSARIVETIQDDEYAAHAMKTLASNAINNTMKRDGEPHDDGSNIAVCHAVQNRLQSSCIWGLADGFLEYGQPGTEYEQAIPFCFSGDLTSDEKNMCLSHLFESFTGWYSQEKIKDICLTLKQPHQDSCMNTLSDANPR